MKTLIIAITTLATIASASAQEKFTVRGEVKYPNAKGGIIYLVGWTKILDSTRISKRGTFVFHSKVDPSRTFAADSPNFGFIEFVPEKGTVRVALGPDIYHVGGTPLNDALQRHRDMVKLPTDSTKAKIARELFDETKDNFIGAYVLSEWIYSFNLPPDTITKLLSGASQIVRENRTITRELTRRQQEVATAVGSQFADFAGVDTLGNALRISDFAGRGQWILLDFWGNERSFRSSDISELRNLQETLKDRSFSILGIGVWPWHPDIAKQAIAKHAAPWANILDYSRSDISISTQTYGITNAPMMILVDPSGKIALRGNHLDPAKVKELVTTTK